jgi:hypothetical protein
LLGDCAPTPVSTCGVQAGAAAVWLTSGVDGRPRKDFEETVVHSWINWIGRSRHTIWAVVCGVTTALTSGGAWAQPVFEIATLDSQRNSQGYAWIDDYLTDSPDGLDYDTLAIASDPQYGSVSMVSEWGLLIYEPDPDYEGFDGFTYTIKDWQGVESEPCYVMVYVEPEGSVTNLAPVIVGLRYENYGNGNFGVIGYVLDDQDSYGRTIEFGGDLQGQTATVGYDGLISYLVTLPPGGSIVTVRYLDPYNVYSEPDFQWVEN